MNPTIILTGYDFRFASLRPLEGPPVPGRHTLHPEDPGLSLALAMVAASAAPLLLIDGDLSLIAISESFCHAFGLDADACAGRTLAELGDGEWRSPQLQILFQTTLDGVAAIDAYEMDLERPGETPRRLVINAKKLIYGEPPKARWLAAIADVTAARLALRKDQDFLRANEARNAELAEQNKALMEEVRHRVANSLQIIASVLLQNAKRTRSDETRGHLKDAHHRVMSVASLERQLAGSGDGDVELNAYFNTLCESIAASMIGEADHIALIVTGAGGVVDARVSVSLGLIVTELVINALKHAFPDHRPGKITVDCAFRGPNWVLPVSDDGVGMPKDPAEIRTGLGTSIVQALARQLSAVVEVEPGHPGTCVAITHTQIALLDDDELSVAAIAAVERPAA